MYPKKADNHSKTIDPLLFEMMASNYERQHPIEQNSHEDADVVIDSDNEEELTSSCISGIEEDEDEETEEEEQHRHQENRFEGQIIHQGNLLHGSLDKTSLNHFLTIAPFSNQKTMVQTQNMIRTVATNNEQMLSQTMAVLAAKHRHTRTSQSTPSENEILNFIGPCPLYSLESSFGLDMYHNLSNFPCRHILAGGGGGGGHHLTCPLWQHLTSFHNLNFPSASQIVRFLLLRGYSIATEKLFTIEHRRTVLRTTPRYALMKTCPLTRYGVYGIRFEHGTRLCSGFTFNTNLFTHLLSFHQMTDQAALNLSRAIGFHEKNFRFHPTEIIIRKPLKTFLIKHRMLIKKKSKKKKPVKIQSNVM